MPIRHVCPQCRGAMLIPEAYIGRAFTCPNCQQLAMVVAPPPPRLPPAASTPPPLPDAEQRPWLRIAIAAGVAVALVIVLGLVINFVFPAPGKLRVEWPVAERSGGELEIDGRREDIAAQGEIERLLPPGVHRIRAWRRGVPTRESKIRIVARAITDFRPEWKAKSSKPSPSKAPDDERPSYILPAATPPPRLATGTSALQTKLDARWFPEKSSGMALLRPSRLVASDFGKDRWIVPAWKRLAESVVPCPAPDVEEFIVLLAKPEPSGVLPLEEIRLIARMHQPVDAAYLAAGWGPIRTREAGGQTYYLPANPLRSRYAAVLIDAHTVLFAYEPQLKAILTAAKKHDPRTFEYAQAATSADVCVYYEGSLASELLATITRVFPSTPAAGLQTLKTVSGMSPSTVFEMTATPPYQATLTFFVKDSETATELGKILTPAVGMLQAAVPPKAQQSLIGLDGRSFLGTFDEVLWSARPAVSGPRVVIDVAEKETFIRLFSVWFRREFALPPGGESWIPYDDPRLGLRVEFPGFVLRPGDEERSVRLDLLREKHTSTTFWIEWSTIPQSKLPEAAREGPSAVSRETGETGEDIQLGAFRGRKLLRKSVRTEDDRPYVAIRDSREFVVGNKLLLFTVTREDAIDADLAERFFASIQLREPAAPALAAKLPRWATADGWRYEGHLIGYQQDKLQIRTSSGQVVALAFDTIRPDDAEFARHALLRSTFLIEPIAPKRALRRIFGRWEQWIDCAALDDADEAARQRVRSFGVSDPAFILEITETGALTFIDQTGVGPTQITAQWKLLMEDDQHALVEITEPGGRTYRGLFTFNSRGLTRLRFQSGKDRIDYALKESKRRPLPALQAAAVAYLKRQSYWISTTDDGQVGGLGNHGQPITQETISKIALFPAIHTLELTGPTLTDGLFQQLTPLTELRFLDLKGAAITARSLPMIGAMRSLRDLNLAEVALEDEAMKHLATLGALQVLNLEKTGISDRGLPSIMVLSSLAVLDLSGNPGVTDRGLRPLLSSKRTTSLEVAGTGVTLEFMLNLRKAHAGGVLRPKPERAIDAAQAERMAARLTPYAFELQGVKLLIDLPPVRVSTQNDGEVTFQSTDRFKLQVSAKPFDLAEIKDQRKSSIDALLVDQPDRLVLEMGGFGRGLCQYYNRTIGDRVYGIRTSECATADEFEWQRSALATLRLNPD